ncbi:hypothetical protein SLEP1_g39055 [Rubroshorea leprosula]|uniref:Uncharacterized protein n=1 Tax=Rubroshorea leprosula TaxID=152421 RepID=A0AAV5KZD2_9ROSI|nr:hypothetical protein SLEP1_g39055 [Rubroshorea leprosula]
MWSGSRPAQFTKFSPLPELKVKTLLLVENYGHEANRNVDAEGDPYTAAGGSHDPSDSSSRWRSAYTVDGSNTGLVRTELDGLLQRLQRLNPKVQAQYAHGRHHNHLQAHREVSLCHVVPQEGLWDRVRK